MLIGFPKALLYYRYGCLWETFFRELGCDILLSSDTCRQTLVTGAKSSIDENCLSLKIFLGHVSELIDQCDFILVPRFTKTGWNEEYCVRFWGLPDLVRNTFPEAPLLICNNSSGRWLTEPAEFIRIGRVLRKSPAHSLRAWRKGLAAQQQHDRQKFWEQLRQSGFPGPKILIAAQPYLTHDPFTGGVIQKLIRQNGGVPLFSDRCDRVQCRNLSQKLSADLYWTLNREAVGAIMLLQDHVDGVILLTAFPCGSDSLVNELVMRKVKDIPLIQIILDEQQAKAGLETRIESFMDILLQRRSSTERL